MRPLILGPDQLADLARIRDFAERHRIGEAVIARYAEWAAAGIRPDPQALQRHRAEVPIGFVVTYTLADLDEVCALQWVWEWERMYPDLVRRLDAHKAKDEPS